jgi:RNA polymerase sigma-70 factor (ECF subfamily)
VIVRELGPLVQGFARARGVRDPEDLMQDVFVGVARGLATFSGEWKAFRAWVLTIAYRPIIDHRRRASRSPVPSASPEEASSAEPTPEDLVTTRAEVGKALAALDVLSDTERDVVLLRIIAGLDTDAVARAVGKRPGNVRVIQSRALQRIRAELHRRGYRASHVTIGGDRAMTRAR